MTRIANTGALRQREPRQRDSAYLRWLHEGIPCIACLIEGTALPIANFPAHRWPIEAAHQHLSIASAGWFEQRGKRVSDGRCVCLCAWHHRLAPNACDVNQRAFWDRLKIGDDVAILCENLRHAFASGLNGGDVVRRWAAGVVVDADG